MLEEMLEGLVYRFSLLNDGDNQDVVDNRVDDPESPDSNFFEVGVSLQSFAIQFIFT